jgi:hypothetical protein
VISGFLDIYPTFCRHFTEDYFRIADDPVTTSFNGGKHAPTTQREFQFVAALRTQLTSGEWKLVTGPSTCGSILAARLNPHHEQGYIVALRPPVRECGHLFQDRVDDLLRSLAAARL